MQEPRIPRGEISTCDTESGSLNSFVIISVCFPWRYRLGVRTEDSQSSNTGSIPVSATIALNFRVRSALKSLETMGSSQHSGSPRLQKAEGAKQVLPAEANLYCYCSADWVSLKAIPAASK